LGLFDSTEEHPPSKIRRYIITCIAFVILVGLGCWYLLRYHTEKNTIRNFLITVAAGKMDEAYRIWKPSPTYSFKDFTEDWGPDSYYGPVKSFRIEDTQHPTNGTGVVVVVEVSPYEPFPANDDFAKQSKTKEVRLWVEFKDQSISYPP
jgi:hypothetical protein